MKLVSSTVAPKHSIRSVTTDRLLRPVICTFDNTVCSLDERTLQWTTIARSEHILFKAVFDSANHCFGATPFGIENLENHTRYYVSVREGDIQTEWVRWQGPEHFLMDFKDRIWIAYDHGEWGGNVELVDSHTMTKVDIPEVEGVFHQQYVHLSSLFQDSTAVYCSTYQPMQNHGTSIIRFDANIPKAIFENGRERRWLNYNEEKVAIKYIHVQSAAFNAYDNSIVFGCHFGVYKGMVGKRLLTLKNWTPLIKYTLYKKNGEVDERAWRHIARIVCLDKSRFVYLMGDGTLKYFNGVYSVTVRE